MADILLLHYGVYGHTRQICERLQSDLVNLGHRADVVPIAGGKTDPAAYDVIVIGASIRNGKHNPAVVDFIRANRAFWRASRARSSPSTSSRVSRPRTLRRPTPT